MINVAKVGDTGIGVCSVGAKCCPHTYTFTIITGSDSVLVNGQPAAHIGSATSTTCPHCPTGTIITGNGTVLTELSPISRVSDTEVVPCGQGNIMTGSYDTYTS